VTGSGPEPPAPEASPHPPSPEADSIARNTGAGFIVRVVGAVFTAGLTVFLVRALGPKEYGEFVLALGVGALVLIPADLGISGSSARFVAESRGKPEVIVGVVSDALRLKVLISGFFALLLVVLSGPIASLYNADLEWPLRVMALAILGQSFLLFFDATFAAIARVSLHVRVVSLESAVETAASIALVVLGTGAVGAMWGRAAGYMVAAGYGLTLLVRVFGRRVLARRGSGGGHMPRIAGYASALLIIDGAFTLFSRIDVLLIGAIISVPAVARFEAPLRVVSFLGYVGDAASHGVAPRLARGGGGADREAFESALRYLILFQGLLVAPALVWAEPLTHLALGDGYAQSAEVLRALTPFIFLLGLSPLVALSVNYLGEARRRVPIAIGVLLVNLVIDLLLLSRIGIVAGAIGTDVAYTLYVLAHIWIIKGLLGTNLRPLWISFLRAMIAAAGTAAVLATFGTSKVPVPLLIVGGIAGTLAYAGLLLLTREVKLHELAHFRSGLRGAVRAGAR
jgi:O-antigen/teichoic acid export membrane protein